MFKFFLKKNFADGWDNLFFIILSNAFSILVIALTAAALRLLPDGGSLLLPALALILAGGVLMTLVFAYGAVAAKVANFDSGGFGTFFRAFTYSWKIGLCSGVALTAAVLVIRFGILYYMSFGNTFGLLMTAILGWFSLISAMALQWFVPLYFLQEQNGFSKCLKKSFIIFFDNPAFSVGCFLYNVLLFALSCVFFLLAPGFSGITLSTTNALRLRLKKYDWLEKMDEADPNFSASRDNRAAVPWSELISEDVETLGPRKLGSFIFPWR